MKKIKLLALIFCFLIFFQSCSVYKPTSLTLNQVSEKDNKIKIRTNDKRTLKFNHIKVIDGSYYGVNKNESKRILIFEKDIESIKLRDRKASTLSTIVLLTGLAALPFVLFGLSFGY